MIETDSLRPPPQITTDELALLFRGGRNANPIPIRPVLAVVKYRWNLVAAFFREWTSDIPLIIERRQINTPIADALTTLIDNLPDAISRAKSTNSTESLWLDILQSLLKEFPPEMLAERYFAEEQRPPRPGQQPWHDPALVYAADAVLLWRELDLGVVSYVADSRFITFASKLLDVYGFHDRRTGKAATTGAVAKWLQRHQEKIEGPHASGLPLEVVKASGRSLSDWKQLAAQLRLQGLTWEQWADSLDQSYFNQGESAAGQEKAPVAGRAAKLPQ